MRPLFYLFVTSGLPPDVKFPEPTLTFRGEDCKQFLAKHNNGLDLFPLFLENLNLVPEDITSMQVHSFRNPFWKISLLFTRITGRESTTTISCMALYILYFTVNEQAIFDWGRLISHEISSHVKLQKEKEILYVILFSFCNSTFLSVFATVSVQECQLRIPPSNVLVPGLVEAQSLPLFFIRFLMAFCMFSKFCC